MLKPSSADWMNITHKVQNYIIGTTRNDQVRYTFCVTWSEYHNFHRTQDLLFNLEMTRKRPLTPALIVFNPTKKVATRLTRSDVFIAHTPLAKGENEADESVCNDIPLVLLATKDTAPCDVVNDLLKVKDGKVATTV